MKTVDFCKNKNGEKYVQVWENDTLSMVFNFDRVLCYKVFGKDPVRFRLDFDRGTVYADMVSLYSDYSGIINLWATEATAAAVEDLLYRWSME